MEYLIVLMLCTHDACAWHKLATPTYSSFEECAVAGKAMDFGNGDYGPVLRAGCALVDDASDVPEVEK